MASYDLQVPNLEQALDEVLTEKLWGAKDNSKVKQAVIAYATGKTKGAKGLQDIASAFQATVAQAPEGTPGLFLIFVFIFLFLVA